MQKNILQKFRFEVCISDNSNNFQSKSIINFYKKKISLIYKKNKKNIGYIKNYVKVVKMAKGEFVWVIGDDEILKPNTFKILSENFKKNTDIDFMYINSNFLKNEYLTKFKNLLIAIFYQKRWKLFQNKKNKTVMFFDLIHHKVSWDFLHWNIPKYLQKRNVFKKFKIYRQKGNVYLEWSTFENTTFYCETYAIKKKFKIFDSKQTYNCFYLWPKSWENLWDFIKIVRIPELLEMYKKKV